MISILSSKAAPSKVVDGVTKSREVLCLVGLSSDTKPATSYKGILICNGSVYDEIDTGKEYLYDEAGGEWHEQPDGDKKKDDPTAEEISVSRGSADAGKVIVVGNDGKLLPVDLDSTGEVAIDRTLKVSGAAADAKVVGDVISSLNGSLDTLINAVPSDTANGSIASFSDGANDIPVKNLAINIEPVQSGTGDPSPDNVRPISGWTGMKVTHTGKNLFGGEALRQRLLEIGGYTYADDDNAIEIGAASLGGKVLFSNFKQDTRYTFIITCKKNAGNTSSNLLLKYDSGSNTTIYLTEPIANKQKVIVTSGADRTLVSINGTNASKGLVIYPDECGIFEGVLTESDFVPYQGNTLDIDWTDEVGEVFGGTLDVTNGIIHPYKYYSSYNGETLSGEWISSLDVYSADASPTIGAQVVDFGEFVEDISITPQEVKTILGENNIFADTGDVSVEYRADIKLYISKVVATAVSALS